MPLKNTMRFGSIAGIPLRVHASWLIALFLATTSLSVDLAGSAGRAAPFIALVTALCLFASLIAHELGHALVAQRRGVGVNSITLFVFGGVATLDSEPKRPRDELAIAIAGPIVSVVIGAVTLALGRSHLLPPVVAEPLTWLGRVNIGLAVFNMLPGFPLDGGRILRGLLWAWNKDLLRATLGAARVGRGIAWTLIALGVTRAFVGSLTDGLWVAFVGWFLLSAARTAAEQADLRATIGDTPIAQAMLQRFPTVPSTMTVAELVRNELVLGGERIYVVVDAEPQPQQAERPIIVGVVTLDRLLAVDRSAWDRTRLRELVIDIAALPMLDARMPMLDAFGKLMEAPLGFVRDENTNTIIGIVDRDRLAAIIGVRLELGRSARSMRERTAPPPSTLQPRSSRA